MFTPEQQALLDKLTKLQQNVALKSIEGLSNIDAYIQGGGKAKTEATIRQCSHEILTNPDVINFINSFQGNIIKKTIMTREEALERLSTLARADMSKLVNFRTVESEDAEGNPVKQAVWDIPDSEDQCVNQLSTISEVTAGPGGIKIKQHDPRQAIKQLADMEGWNSPTKIEVSPMQAILEEITQLEDGLPRKAD